MMIYIVLQNYKIFNNVKKLVLFLSLLKKFTGTLTGDYNFFNKWSMQ